MVPYDSLHILLDNKIDQIAQWSWNNDVATVALGKRVSTVWMDK